MSIIFDYYSENPQYKNIYHNFINLNIYNIELRDINLDDYKNINSDNNLKEYKNKLLKLYTLINKNNSDVCDLKNFCILNIIIISKLLNENYLDNNDIINYLNKIIKNYELVDFNYFNIYSSYRLITYICHFKLYKFNNNDIQNYYNYMFKNSNNKDIYNKIFLGIILNSNDYDIIYDINLYNKEKIIEFSKLFIYYTFNDLDTIKLIFNVLFTIKKINHGVNKPNDFINESILVNIIINPFNDNTNNLFDYYSKYIEDLYYNFNTYIRFLHISNDKIITFFNKLIDNGKLTVDNFNIIYKFISNNDITNYCISEKKEFIKNKTNIMNLLINYIKHNFNLDEKFYKNIFYNESKFYIKNSHYDISYYYNVLELVIPKIKSFNILYNIFYYKINIKKLYDLIDKKYFNQNILELALLVYNHDLIDYYIENNLVAINNHNFILSLHFNERHIKLDIS